MLSRRFGGTRRNLVKIQNHDHDCGDDHAAYHYDSRSDPHQDVAPLSSLLFLSAYTDSHFRTLIYICSWLAGSISGLRLTLGKASSHRARHKCEAGVWPLPLLRNQKATVIFCLERK